MLEKNIEIKSTRMPKEWTLEEIAEKIKEIKQDNPDPLLVQEWRNWLSAEYATVSFKLQSILFSKAEKWQKIRKETKTDKEADLKYDKTSVGKQERLLKARLKVIEKLLSALRTQLEVWNIESYNQY